MLSINDFNYGNVSKKEQNVNTYTLMCTLNQQEIYHVDITSSYWNAFWLWSYYVRYE